MNPQLSVVVLTLNEASRIRRCLDSIKIPARVLVLDSFSTDGTLVEAQRSWKDSGRSPCHFAAVARRWRGFTEARNASLKWVQTPWVLWLDADEWLSPALNEELKTYMASRDPVPLLRFPRQSYFLGRAIRHGGWFPDRKRRMARSEQCHWRSGPFGADVHEDLEVKGDDRIYDFKATIEHESFRDIAEQEESNDRYSTLLAEGLAQKLRAQNKRAPSQGYIAVKVAIKFIENYIFKLGILDGWPGFVIARGSAKSLRMRLEKCKAIMGRGSP